VEGVRGGGGKLFGKDWLEFYLSPNEIGLLVLLGLLEPETFFH
jgi:hypothetical protein